MCIILHNDQVGISGNILYFLTFCLNTSTKFREPYRSNHVIPHLVQGSKEEAVEVVPLCENGRNRRRHTLISSFFFLKTLGNI